MNAKEYTMNNNSSSKTMSVGVLYIVATPIGNRNDISQRAIETLLSVDLILAEDTRHSKLLLLPLGIATPMVSLHAHNESEKLEEVISALQQGKQLALISDAGTPLISDPGFELVRHARQLNIPVVPIPGACALITALSASGVPCDMFTFMGFLPAKSSARCKKLESLRLIEHTVIFYESTHRIAECLNDIAKTLGEDSRLVLTKELTKTFETFVSGTCQEIIKWLQADPAHCKGEFVLIFPPKEIQPQHTHHALLSVLIKELPLKQAVKIACQLTGGSKNELYDLALKLSEGA
jgi:16S rRNA (cytidine1402-2'-O)-methyltransferase